MSRKPGARPSRRGKPRPIARSRRAPKSQKPASSRARTSRPVAKKASATGTARKKAGVRTRAVSSRPKRAAKVTAKVRVRAVAKPNVRAAAKPRTAIRAAKPIRAIRAAKPIRAHVNSVHPAPAPVPAAFSAQRAGASAREELLFELQRARASVKAATQGLTSANAERPIAPGKWSIKEIVLHLSERDRVRLEELGRTLGGQPRSWAGISDDDQCAVNEVHLAPLRAHTWDEAVRRLDSLREQLLLRVSQLPAQPDDLWQRSHAFGDMMWGLPEHDRHHAHQIKLARLGELVPVEE